MLMILLVVLVLLSVGSLPPWPHSKSWGYFPSGGLGLKPERAIKFYGTLGAATIAGLAMNFIHLDPTIIAAVINGMLAAPVMALMMLLTQNRKVMEQFTLPRSLKILGWSGAAAMCAASAAFLMGLFKSAS